MRSLDLIALSNNDLCLWIAFLQQNVPLSLQNVSPIPSLKSFFYKYSDEASALPIHRALPLFQKIGFTFQPASAFQDTLEYLKIAHPEYLGCDDVIRIIEFITERPQVTHTFLTFSNMKLHMDKSSFLKFLREFQKEVLLDPSQIYILQIFDS